MSEQQSDNPMNNVMRHKDKPLSPEQKGQIATIKDLGLLLYNSVEGLGQSRELSLAKTKVEEAVMWATKHVKG